MRYETPLIDGTLLRRYKRFLVDVQLDDGRTVTAHTSNTGSMIGCSDPGSGVRLSYHDNPDRKYPYTLECVRVGRVWVGVNTIRANEIARQGILRRRIPELVGYERLRSEVSDGYGSRLDLLLEDDHRRCFVEVKNVTMAFDRVAYFPDAVTTRGARHLSSLVQLARDGHRAVALYLVQRSDVDSFQVADFIDPVYGQALRAAARAGVEILAYGVRLTRQRSSVCRRLPVELSLAHDPRRTAVATH
jgi:sugar fermentation stimulation protein A